MKKRHAETKAGKKLGLYIRHLLLSTLLTAVMPFGVAMSAGYPSRPITIMSWSSAGSSTDLMAREIAHIMSHDLGVSVIVQNRTGGSGANAMYALLGKPADGYTLLVNTDSMLADFNTTLKGKFKLSQFDFLALMESDPFVLVVNADSPYTTLKALVTGAKQKRLAIGGFGATSAQYAQTALLAQQAGFKLHWVPFKGGRKADVALLGNHVDADMSNLSRIAQDVKAGKMRALAISGKERSPSLSNVQTFEELGFPKHKTNHWRGIMAKAGLPENVKATLEKELKQVVESTQWKGYIAKTHMTPEFETSAEFTKTAQTGLVTMGKVLNAAR